MKIAGYTIFQKSEKRDTTSLKNPSNWFLRWLGVESNNVAVTESNTLGLTAAWAAVNLISNTVAGLPAKALTDEKGLKKALPHPISTLLSSRPNGYMRPFMFRYIMIARALLNGNSYAIIKRGVNAEPLELIPVHNVTIAFSEGKKFYKVKGYEELISDDNMFHIMGMSLDGIIGLSVISFHESTLGLNLAAQKFAETTYKKGTHLKGYLTTANSMRDTAVENLKKSWSEQYGGPDGKDTAFLDNGLEYKSLSLSMADAQIIETRKYGVEDIARIFSVPPHKIGDLSRSTNNNIEHQSIEFVQDCIMYWAMRFEQEADFKLRTEREKSEGKVYTNLELKGLMRGDAKSRIEFMKGMWEMGSLSANGALVLEDMDTFEGGDVKTIQMNRIPVDMIEDFVKSLIEKRSKSKPTK
jgi:HK97 family phage portal protein